MDDTQSATRSKALAVNLDPCRYGSFAEIGAGQEVVRWFFRAGGAAGTISKSISAYDMKVSDAIYGPCQRYVCRERLEAMLQLEQDLNRERLAAQRGTDAGFFAFADTVSARNYHGTNECHGWMGIQWQQHPGAPDSRILIHMRMLDPDNALQQEALGIVGVNLIHGAFNYSSEPEVLLAAMLDNLTTERIEIDVVEFSGAAFESIDNRVMALHLVRLGLTGAAMFSADGKVLQPSAVLRKRPLLIERGRFRPLTHVNIDMLDCALSAFHGDCENELQPPLPILEIAMHSLTSEGDVCLDDFISRADTLATTGHVVMISDFPEYYRLAEYLYRYTHSPIALVMGLSTLKALFNPDFYGELEGGMLEAFGRLFKNRLKLMIYPERPDPEMALRTLDNAEFARTTRDLLSFLTRQERVVGLQDVNESLLDIFSHDVLAMIANNDPDWDMRVPDGVAAVIREKGLFGCEVAARSEHRLTKNG